MRKDRWKMAYQYTVVARDRAQKVLGESTLDLPHTLAEAIELGYASNEHDLICQFNAALVVKIQAGLRLSAKTPSEVASTTRKSLARAFYATLNGSE